MGYEMILFGAAATALYSLAGYFKAVHDDPKNTSFSLKSLIRTVVTGAVPPIAVLVLNWFNIQLPAGFDLVNFLGPALDKFLKSLGV